MVCTSQSSRYPPPIPSLDRCSEHLRNMKEFKICVGLRKDRMTKVLSATLKDDSVPEAFTLRLVNRAGVPFPSRYLKIIPISCVI